MAELQEHDRTLGGTGVDCVRSSEGLCPQPSRGSDMCCCESTEKPGWTPPSAAVVTQLWMGAGGQQDLQEGLLV